jgi:hypothetical protein
MPPAAPATLGSGRVLPPVGANHDDALTGAQRPAVMGAAFSVRKIQTWWRIGQKRWFLHKERGM